MQKGLILYLLLYFNSSFTQNLSGEIQHALQHKYKLDYRVNYFDKMIFKVDVNSEIDNFYIPKLNFTNDKRSLFTADEKLRLRLSFDYKFIGISYSFIPNFTTQTSNDVTNTKILDLSFKFFYSDQLRQEVIFRKVKGFSLRNPDELNPIKVFNNLQINTFGGKTFYIVNNDFSYRAYESQTERQIKSAGTLLPSISYYLNDLFTNNPNETTQHLERIKSFNFIFQLGYMHNYVINKTWFVTGGIHPGVSINFSKSFYTLDNQNQQTNNRNKTNFNIDFNLSLGYNHENFFSGIKTNYKNYQYDTKNISDIINTKINASFFIGYRFKEIKAIKKIFDKIEKKN